MLRETYEDTLVAAADADLLVSHPLAAFSSRLVAEKTGKAWVSAMLVPLGFFSAYDLPVVDVLPLASRWLRPLGPAFWGPLLRCCKRASRFVAEPWYRLRRELGLPPTNELNPLSESHSPRLVLATFSKWFAEKQPDWPPQTVVTGFPLYDAGGELPPELVRFLDAGPPPIVFTLGTAVSSDAGTFFAESAAAARRLGRRAVLILKEPRNRPGGLPDEIFACDYAPFSLLFPRAAAVVHHAGIGTTGLAMHAGRPMLVMPCAWDQPDHAARIARLGVGRVLSRRRYASARVAAELGRLLDDPAYARRASELGERVRQENGVAAACDAIEGVARGRAALLVEAKEAR
ncbi:MAG TPA: nucleotide disphospho-sugar-binding domain-containing protein [Pirellulales bacterium]|nr:nucleotide disphospho-sugar-binding domain-containing protein [Pirellulales bacterium]